MHATRKWNSKRRQSLFGDESAYRGKVGALLPVSAFRFILDLFAKRVQLSSGRVSDLYLRSGRFDLGPRQATLRK